MKKIILVVLIIIAGIIILTLVPKKEKITIGMVTFPGYAPLYIAEAKGYFGDIETELVFIDDLGQLRSAFESGKIDIMVATYDMFQTIQDREPNGIAFLMIDESRGADALLAPSSIQNPKDLKNKIVGVEPGFPPYLILQAYLNTENMSLADISVKDIPSKDIPSGFISNSIEIAATYEPYITELLQKNDGIKVLTSSKDFPGLAADFLWVLPSTLDNKTEELRIITDGYFKAVDLIKNNPEEAFTSGGQAFGVSSKEMSEFSQGIIWPDLNYNQVFFNSESEKNIFKTFNLVNNILKVNNETNVTLDANNHVTNKIINSLNYDNQ